MTYRLGVDVGGTFTDLLLVNEKTGQTWKAKVSSTPHDQSEGVLRGIERVCGLAAISPEEIDHVMHGTTVATNTVLTGTGARVGLVTTKGYRQVLQIARSFVPGGLGGWVIYNKSLPMAPLALTIEADERVGSKGDVVTALNEAKLRDDLVALGAKNIEALTVSLINAFANDKHERRIKEIAQEVLPGIPVSLSSEVVPEMQEYERTVTTVANSYVRPRVQKYVHNLKTKLSATTKSVKLHILRSDGGLASAKSAEDFPVNLLMSGPAGGVTGALWGAVQAGFPNLLTVDVGGTSTDVALIMNGQPRLRRETTVGDVTVRASSVDIRTVGAGGGSIAHVPELTGALRVGPQSAGADPGPAAYGKGGTEPTVTDANVVLGYLPEMQKLGGDMALDRKLAQQAVEKVGKALGKNAKDAALGIYNIVNENMVGALRLVSVEQGHDPRDYALIAFGGAGPLHANALSILLGSWPSIIPPGPGVLCALGDATTAVRDESSRTYIRKFSETSKDDIVKQLKALATDAAKVARRREGGSEGHGVRLPGGRALPRPGAASHRGRGPEASREGRTRRDQPAVRRGAHAALHVRAAARARVRRIARRGAGQGHQHQAPGHRARRRIAGGRGRRQAEGVHGRQGLRGDGVRPCEAQGRQSHRRSRDRDGNGLDLGDPAAAPRQGGCPRQHPDLPRRLPGAEARRAQRSRRRLP